MEMILIMLFNEVFHGLAQKGRENYKTGIMSLLSSNLIYNIKVKYAHKMIQKFAIYGLIFFVIIYLPILLCSEYMDVCLQSQAENFIFSIGLGIVEVAVVIYIICGLLIVIFDLDTVESYLKGYKKSSYYLATTEERNAIIGNEGLIGEYKGYVLSRTLKVPHKVLHNVCIPMRNGNFQEVDTIIITRNIIYVVECKNRVGKFIGAFDEKEWIQQIGNQEKVTDNIYMQNQQHTMALDQFLLNRGIIQNGQNVCINVLLTTGKMKLSTKGPLPLDFVVGDARKIRAYIESQEKRFDDGTDTSGIMNQIYEALLPYALYTKVERIMMMEERRIRSVSKEFAIGEFQTRYVNSEIAGVTKAGEQAEVRSNRLYTQVKIKSGKKYCWQTRTDIGSQMRMNVNACSKGVNRERVDTFKQTVGEDPKLILKKIVWIGFGVSVAILIGATRIV